jgi:hypothetical protein
MATEPLEPNPKTEESDRETLENQPREDFVIERGGVGLEFDEADSLFDKRGEVKKWP